MDFFIDYIDLAWIVLVPFLVRKRLWIKTIFFILACVLMLRFQVELMEVIGFPSGFVGLLDYPLMERGIITYGIFIALFLILTHFSQNEDTYVFMAAAISVFFAAFIVSSIVLVL
jgi:hypothetical protein